MIEYKDRSLSSSFFVLFLQGGSITTKPKGRKTGIYLYFLSSSKPQWTNFSPCLSVGQHALYLIDTNGAKVSETGFGLRLECGRKEPSFQIAPFSCNVLSWVLMVEKASMPCQSRGDRKHCMFLSSCASVGHTAINRTAGWFLHGSSAILSEGLSLQSYVRDEETE